MLSLVLSLFFGFHPQDGPHAEVDLLIEEEKIILVVTANLAWLDELVEIPRELPDNLHPSETEDAVEQLRGFLFNVPTIVVDGTSISNWTSTSPIANHPDPALLPLFPNAGMRGLRKWRFTFQANLTEPPQQVTLRWHVFAPDRISDPLSPPPLAVTGEIQSQGLVDPFMLTPAEPAYTWHRSSGELGARLEPYTNPIPVSKSTSNAIAWVLIGSIAIMIILTLSSNRRWPVIVTAGLGVGAATCIAMIPPQTLRPQDLEDISRALHRNMYRSFDYTERESVYDSLALSVDGLLLDSIYEEIFASLVMREEGGAVARVTSITHHDVVTEPAFRIMINGEMRWNAMVRVHWTVRGRVTHWGHSHQRADRWAARFRLQEAEDGWRFTEGVFEERIPEDMEIPDVL